MKKTLLLVIVLLVSSISIAQNLRNVVLYNLTSTGCGPCSCMDSIIRHTVIPQFPRTVVIALHSPSPIGMSHFWDYQGNQIFHQFHSLQEPDGFIDGLGHDVLFSHLADSLDKRYAESPEAPVRIAMDTLSWDPSGRKVKMNVSITNLSGDLPGSYWYNVFVTENNIMETHRIQLGCAKPDDPGGQPLRHNYFNDHVTRKLEFWEHGDSLIGPLWPSGQTFTKSLSIGIDSGWVPENCFLNLLVYLHADSIYKSPIQQAISQSVTGGVGIDPVENKPASDGIIQVYPNPASDRLNIHFTVARTGSYTLDIYSVSGRKIETILEQVLETGTYNVDYQLNDLPSGNYIVTLRTREGEKAHPFQIRR
jgi:hypothetical protein